MRQVGCAAARSRTKKDTDFAWAGPRRTPRPPARAGRRAAAADGPRPSTTVVAPPTTTMTAHARATAPMPPRPTARPLTGPADQARAGATGGSGCCHNSPADATGHRGLNPCNVGYRRRHDHSRRTCSGRPAGARDRSRSRADRTGGDSRTGGRGHARTGLRAAAAAPQPRRTRAATVSQAGLGTLSLSALSPQIGRRPCPRTAHSVAGVFHWRGHATNALVAVSRQLLKRNSTTSPSRMT